MTTTHGTSIDLFPPVRPRGGYLEIRYLGAQPLGRIGDAVAAVAGLLYDTRARHDALDLLLPRASDQQRAWAEVAAGHTPQGGDLLSIVRTGVPADARLTAGAS